jgi:ABC-type multidrug transport system fused ATPase/permease subunit
MRDFITFARRVVHDRGRLVLALLCSLISAGNMGAGLVTLMPMVRLMVAGDEAPGLPDMAREFNAEGRQLAGMSITVPEGVIAMLPEGRFEGVALLIAAIGVLTIIGAAANFTHQYLSITVATRSIANARAELFRSAMDMPIAAVSRRGASEFVSRIIRDTAELQRGLIAVMSKAVASSMQAVVMFAVAIALGRSITFIALLVVPILAVFLRKVGKRIRRGTHGALAGQEELLRIATETVQGLRVVKSNRAEDELAERFEIVNRQVIRNELRAQVTRAFASPVTEALAFLIVGGLMLFAARQIIAGEILLSQIVLSLGALALAGSKMKILSQLVNDLQGADATARRMLDVMEETPEADVPNAITLPRHAESIRFEGVRYRYPGAEDDALRGIDLTINHGERVAVVGPNGCGKSTLLGLLPRLLVPTAGRVLIDDHDLAGVTRASLRDQMAVVTQESVLFRGTIAENIRLGRRDTTDADVRRAAEQARASEFIEALPNGYDSDVSEQGQSMSGGQRQRLCIARAILRDPSILILDEATSQVDSESEALITEAIAAFARDRTVLLIAHRLATVLDADRIVVMDAGRILDQGVHTDLLERCDLYARLCRTQLVAAEG